MRKTYTVDIDWPEKNTDWNGWKSETLEDYIKNAIEGWYGEIGQAIFVDGHELVVISVTEKE